MVNHWYKYYIRNFPVNEADPLTQRLKELHRDEWGEVPNLAKLRHYFYRLDDERDIYGTTAASVIDRKPAPAPPASVVHTDFLNLGSSEGKRVSSLFAPGFDNALQDRLIRQALSRDYTALAFYVMNENDGDWANHKKVFNGYTTHRGAVLRWAEKCYEAGLQPIPCLCPDDAPEWHGKLTDPWKAWNTITHELPPLLNRMATYLTIRPIIWLGLEMNEYLWPKEMVDLGALTHDLLPDAQLIYHFTTERPAASPVRENKEKPVNEWPIPDPYGWEGPWWKAVQLATEHKGLLAYQSGIRDIQALVNRFKAIRARADGHWGVKFPLWIGEIGHPSEPEEVIRARADAIRANVQIDGSLHG